MTSQEMLTTVIAAKRAGIASTAFKGILGGAGAALKGTANF